MDWLYRKLNSFWERKEASHAIHSSSELSERLSKFTEDEERIVALSNCVFMYAPTINSLMQHASSFQSLPTYTRALRILLTATPERVTVTQLYRLLSSIERGTVDEWRRAVLDQLCRRTLNAELGSQEEVFIADFILLFAGDDSRLHALRSLSRAVRWNTTSAEFILLFKESSSRRIAFGISALYAPQATIEQIREILSNLTNGFDQFPVLHSWCKKYSSIDVLTVDQVTSLVGMLSRMSRVFALETLIPLVWDPHRRLRRILDGLNAGTAWEIAVWETTAATAEGVQRPALRVEAEGKLPIVQVGSAPRKTTEQQQQQQKMKPNERALANGVFVPQKLPGQRKQDGDACIACCEFARNVVFEQEDSVLCSGYCAPCALRILERSAKCPQCNRDVIRMMTYF